MKIDEQLIIDACSNSLTMAEAASKTPYHYNTFSRHAKRLGVYAPNKGAKGTSKPKTEGKGKTPLADILNGKYPQYQTFKLKTDYIQRGLKKINVNVVVFPNGRG